MPPCEPYALELEQVGCQTRQERRRVRSSALSNGLAAQRNHEPETSDLLALTDLGVSEVMTIIERAQDMAAFWNQRRMVQSLAGRRFALVVNDSGWRNTTAFDLGIQAMGGICAHAPLRWDAREDLADLAAYLDNWLDGIVTRAPDLSVIRRLASAARAPVINARTRQNHPCEIARRSGFSSPPTRSYRRHAGWDCFSNIRHSRIVDRGCGGSADQRRSGLSRQVARSRSGGFHTALSYQYRYQRACRCGHHRDRLLAARCRIRTLAGLSNHARTAGQAPPKGRLRALPPGIARQRGVRRRDDAPGMSRDRSQGIPAPTPKMRFWNGHATPVRPARMSDRGSFPDAASGGIPCELFAGHFRVQSTRSVDKFRFCRNVSKVSRLLESRSPEMTLPASCCRLFSTVVNDRHFDSAVRWP